MDDETELYIESHIDPEGDTLRGIYRATHLRHLYPRMCSGHLQGRMLKMFVRMIAPREVLEIGTYTGYSALCLAEGLADDSCRVRTVEINDEAEDFIRSNLAASPYGRRVELYIGDALEVLPRVGGEYDLVLIDGNKRDYVEYYELTLGMVRPGGFILADNTLWSGKVADAAGKVDAQTAGILRFNDHVAADTRVEKVIIPIRDGLTIIRKI